jgi:hypothetical protein
VVVKTAVETLFKELKDYRIVISNERPTDAELGGPFLLAVNSSGSMAIFAAILRASSFVSNLAADPGPAHYAPP